MLPICRMPQPTVSCFFLFRSICQYHNLYASQFSTVLRLSHTDAHRMHGQEVSSEILRRCVRSCSGFIQEMSIMFVSAIHPPQMRAVPRKQKEKPYAHAAFIRKSALILPRKKRMPTINILFHHYHISSFFRVIRVTLARRTYRPDVSLNR